ncbi:MAG TPA: bifunctional demethylmenaquinone methyltransferase/2-methoxy-6-polyprenyl-1,4-benzoquinol methylase UbiE [Candidatus Tidjanibacter gallistercoris]|nr:bifunctional demethylmenaquinone methyltransferase/2-methoxy-6-polyprenyl-1,4-benzoquinol methylase UbiE [Candidatus Tidjanibacter gallistercoris]
MGETKKAQVRAMFDSIAPKYDLLNHLLSFGVDRLWRRRMVGAVAAAAPEEVLDVAAGTGDVAIAMARRMPRVRITGIDLSGEMLAVGRGKVARLGLDGRIVLKEGDAERLPFPDASFDAVSIGFGIRNFGSIEAGLSEAFRVLRRGGCLYILEFSTPCGRLFGPLYRFYFHRILPRVGRVVSKDRGAYSYLPDSVDHFPDNLLFLRMMGDAGFTGCRDRRQMRGIAYIYEGRKE